MEFAMKGEFASGAETVASMTKQGRQTKRAGVRVKQRWIKFKLNREIGPKRIGHERANRPTL